MAFTTQQGNERVRIATNGNVGIGPTSPSTKLDVSGGISYANSRIKEYMNSYVVNKDSPKTLKNYNGNEITSSYNGYVYRVRLTTTGTGTNTGAVYLLDNVDGNG
jgi:hypothetical protein